MQLSFPLILPVFLSIFFFSVQRYKWDKGWSKYGWVIHRPGRYPSEVFVVIYCNIVKTILNTIWINPSSDILYRSCRSKKNYSIDTTHNYLLYCKNWKQHVLDQSDCLIRLTNDLSYSAYSRQWISTRRKWFVIITRSNNYNSMNDW